jgi:pimeloyl-ACP methyl ester carboxylesterase
MSCIGVWRASSSAQEGSRPWRCLGCLLQRMQTSTMSATLIDGGLVHYETVGRGRPVIFLHGWLGSWRYWAATMDEAATAHRAYALDLWGFGDSDKRLQRCSVEQYVELVLALMEYLGIQRASFVGHALGAAVALRLAAANPERADRIMAVAVPLTADGINRRVLTTGGNKALGRLFWSRQSPYPEVEIETAKAVENLTTLTIQDVARLDLRTALEQITLPVLAVYGAKDGVVHADQAALFEAEEWAARAIVLQDARHFPMLDEASKFNRLLLDFLRANTQEEVYSLSVKEPWRRRWR